jgi:hypothetical protein
METRPRARRKSFKDVPNDVREFSALAKAVYGTDEGLSPRKRAAINREVSRRCQLPDEKTSHPSRYIKTLPPNLVTFDALAEAMFGEGPLLRWQMLVVEQEVIRRRFQSTSSGA